MGILTMGKADQKLARTATLTTQETIRKQTRSKSPSLSPAVRVTELRQLIHAKENPGWIWRSLGRKPNPRVIAALWVDIAKNQIKLQEQENAANSYIQAAEQYKQANQPNEMITCRRQAVQQFTNLVHGPSAEEKESKYCHSLLIQAI